MHGQQNMKTFHYVTLRYLVWCAENLDRNMVQRLTLQTRLFYLVLWRKLMDFSLYTGLC